MRIDTLIFMLAVAHRPMTTQEMADRLGVRQSNVSAHMCHDGTKGNHYFNRYPPKNGNAYRYGLSVAGVRYLKKLRAVG